MNQGDYLGLSELSQWKRGSLPRRRVKNRRLEGWDYREELPRLALEMKEEGRHEARKVSGLWKLQKARNQILPYSFWEGIWLCWQWGPWWSSDKQNCKIVYLCCFKPLFSGDLLWQQWKTNTYSYPKGFYSLFTQMHRIYFIFIQLGIKEQKWRWCSIFLYNSFCSSLG